MQVAEGHFSAVSQAEGTRILCQTTGLYHTLRCYQGCVVSLSPSALTLVLSSRGTVQERKRLNCVLSPLKAGLSCVHY